MKTFLKLCAYGFVTLIFAMSSVSCNADKKTEESEDSIDKEEVIDTLKTIKLFETKLKECQSDLKSVQKSLKSLQDMGVVGIHERANLSRYVIDENYSEESKALMRLQFEHGPKYDTLIAEQERIIHKLRDNKDVIYLLHEPATPKGVNRVSFSRRDDVKFLKEQIKKAKERD